MKLKNGFILREVAGDIVVVPSGKTMNLNMMITLNDTAKFLWELMENEISEEQLVEALLNEYEISPEDALIHVKKFDEKLNEYGFLE